MENGHSRLTKGHIDSVHSNVYLVTQPKEPHPMLRLKLNSYHKVEHFWWDNMRSIERQEFKHNHSV